MPKNYLILTPLCHNRILKDFKRVKYLGGWCLNVDDSDSSEKTIKYHWDDRKKLASDYIFLDGLYEEFLRKMSRTLNKKHKLNEDNEFWRIIIGPWLGCFLHILFDRFEQLRKAIKDEPEIQIIAFKNLVINKPKDTQDFAKNFIPSDYFNQFLFQFIAESLYQNRISYVTLEIEEAKFGEKYHQRTNTKSFFRNTFYKLINRLAKNSRSFFYQDGLNLNSKLRLYFNERSIPFIGSIEKEFESENFHNSGNYDLDSFEEIAEFLVNKLIPLSYTKLYERYRSLGINKFPTSPKKLFTSLAYFQDDIFKIYAAEKKKQGSIFCIFQHGGNFGTTPFAFLEEHQIKSSTYWYSWGWKSEKFGNVIPVGNLRTKKTMREKSFFGSSRNKLLIVCMSLPRYSYCLYPVPLGPQYIQYLDFLGNFYNSLCLETQKKSIVRLHSGDFGWNQDKRWRRISKDVVFDKNSNIYKSVFSSKIVVVTYNATTLIEMFFWNVPMILLLDEKYWELNEESKIVYDKLKKYSIFQTSPKECADFIDSIWDDVDTWWYSPEVQKSRKAFLEIYSKHGDFKKL